MMKLNNLLESYFHELRAMSDEDVLDGEEPSSVKARALAVLESAKVEADRRRLMTAQSQAQSVKVAEAQTLIQKQEAAATSNTDTSVLSGIGSHLIEAGKQFVGKGKIVTLKLEELLSLPAGRLVPVLDDGHSEKALGCWEIPLSDITEDSSLNARYEALIRIEVFNPEADKDVLTSGGELFFSVQMAPQNGGMSNPVDVQLSIGSQSCNVTVNETEPQYFILKFRPNQSITLQGG